jgi:hypothetical protein
MHRWEVLVRINLFLLPIFPQSSHSIVVFLFSVGLSLLSQHSQQVLLAVEVSSISWLGQSTVICWDNNERPTGKKNTTIEWDDGGKIGNKNKLILTGEDGCDENCLYILIQIEIIIIAELVILWFDTVYVACR